MPSIDALADRLSAYLGKDQVNLVRRAYFYAEQAHDGQRRRSGEAYVTHPLAVANILADMHMDHQSLMAGNVSIKPATPEKARCIALADAVE